MSQVYAARYPLNFESTTDWLNRSIGKEAPIAVEDTPPLHLDMLKKGMKLHRDLSDLVVHISMQQEQEKRPSDAKRNVQRISHVSYSQFLYVHMSWLCDKLDLYPAQDQSYWNTEFASWYYEDFFPRLLKQYLKCMQLFHLRSSTYSNGAEVYQRFILWVEEKKQRIEEERKRKWEIQEQEEFQSHHRSR